MTITTLKSRIEWLLKSGWIERPTTGKDQGKPNVYIVHRSLDPAELTEADSSPEGSRQTATPPENAQQGSQQTPTPSRETATR